MRKTSFLMSKMNQTVIFLDRSIFQNLTCWNIFDSKTNALYFFQTKIWRLVNFLNENPTCCIIFILNSNTLYNLLFEICFSNRLFRFSLNFYQTATNYQLVGKWRQLGVKDFLRVCGMRLSHFCYYLFLYCVLYGACVLDGCDDYIICTTDWFMQICFEFRKWLVYKDFILKDTK